MINTRSIGVTPKQFQELIELPVSGPIQMLNLLKFKEEVEGVSLSGEQAYDSYLKAAMPFIEKASAKLIYQGKPLLPVIGPDEKEWDKILIVEYPSKENFLAMITNENYPKEMRERALEDSRLILCNT